MTDPPCASQNGHVPFDLASENGHVEAARLVDIAALAHANPLVEIMRSLFASYNQRGAPAAGAHNATHAETHT